MRYLLFLFILFNSCVNNTDKQTILEGISMGLLTVLYIFLKLTLPLKVKIDSIFNSIDMSMSTYNSNSLITKINNNKEVLLDDHFKYVFNTSKKIYHETSGDFDPSIGPLVNSLDFGPKTNNISTDSLMNLVGLDKFKIFENKLVDL